MTKQYTWNTSRDDERWDYGIFDSIEECIEDSKNYEVTNSIFIGEVEPYEIYVDADRVLEDLEQDATDECGEAADSWCPSYDIKQDDINMLSVKLTNVIKGWLRERNYYPSFYNIINIREIDVDSGLSIGSMY